MNILHINYYSNGVRAIEDDHSNFTLFFDRVECEKGKFTNKPFITVYQDNFIIAHLHCDKYTIEYINM